ncbi:integral membrane regulator [Streptomyces pluripotens]|uniref:Integral membrane regulator n=1 Tax=Streptomyces pluripotens TaxID=1355015 RepID=A0A221P069_9ACTN|nr:MULTISPECIES: Pr6Pr family membrane protein [Streptomyces]ARP70910.1 integral membrane regulator [Streptomyces pluripotens]ASN25165.1 integral membrane regulator [Streptomyces pluripotens]KIE27343.1 integral membrane regulator [Streptomyces sp. MUSC 125]MCH0557694.1 Pr6Pr family membrane protein [Streptomyces sp. MUM 16J]
MIAPIPRDIPDLPAVPGPPLLLPAPVPATAVVAPARRPPTAVFRLLTAVVAAAGVALQFLLGTPARTLSYFSIQTNALLALVMFLSAARAWRARRPLPSAITGAALLYALITALAYHLLLGHASPPFSMTAATTPPERWHAQWVALQLLHTLAPALALLDWLFLTPATRLHLRQAVTWLFYPLAYLAFSLARAAFLPPSAPSRYLYPFLDVDAHGYRSTLANALLLGLAIYALAVLLVTLDHVRPTPVRHRV